MATRIEVTPYQHIFCMENFNYLITTDVCNCLINFQDYILVVTLFLMIICFILGMETMDEFGRSWLSCSESS